VIIFIWQRLEVMIASRKDSSYNTKTHNQLSPELASVAILQEHNLGRGQDIHDYDYQHNEIDIFTMI